MLRNAPSTSTWIRANTTDAKEQVCTKGYDHEKHHVSQRPCNAERAMMKTQTCWCEGNGKKHIIAVTWETGLGFLCIKVKRERSAWRSWLLSVNLSRTNQQCDKLPVFFVLFSNCFNSPFFCLTTTWKDSDAAKRTVNVFHIWVWRLFLHRPRRTGCTIGSTGKNHVMVTAHSLHTELHALWTEITGF